VALASRIVAAVRAIASLSFRDFARSPRAIHESDRLDLEAALQSVPLYLTRGQFQDVIRVVNRLEDTAGSPRQVSPSWFIYRALAQDACGDIEAAIRSYGLALEGDPEHTTALVNLATILACSPDDRYHDAARAVELAERTCSINGESEWAPWQCLASALARRGDFALAHSALEKARKSAPRDMQWRVDRLAESIAQEKPFTLSREEFVSRLQGWIPSAQSQTL
jgi:tetratricopeptide (TPR) repeat protein